MRTLLPLRALLALSLGGCSADGPSRGELARREQEGLAAVRELLDSAAAKKQRAEIVRGAIDTTPAEGQTGRGPALAQEPSHSTQAPGQSGSDSENLRVEQERLGASQAIDTAIQAAAEKHRADTAADATAAAAAAERMRND